MFTQLGSRFDELENLYQDTFAYVILASTIRIAVDVVLKNDAGEIIQGEAESAALQRSETELSYVKFVGPESCGGSFSRSGPGEIIAISKASNEVAGWFGVTPQLPCMLIFDAYADSPPSVVKLTSQIFENLIPIFREVVGKISGPMFREQLSVIQKIGELDSEVPVRLSSSVEQIRQKEVEAIERKLAHIGRIANMLNKSNTAGEVCREISVLGLTQPEFEQVSHIVRRTAVSRRKFLDAIRKTDECLASLGTLAENDVKPKRVFRRRAASKTKCNTLCWVLPCRKSTRI
jgi:hypothetical protein